MKKLFVVSDWAGDALAFPQFYTSVEGRLKNDTPRPTILPVATSPSTIHASYLARQLVETEKRYGRPEETVVLIEASSHSHVQTAQETAASAPFYIVRLACGIYVMGTNSGYTFTLLKDQIADVFTFESIDMTVAFGARDEYSRMCAYLLEYMEDELEFDEVHTYMIPELVAHHVGHVDVFGNIQTTVTVEDLKGKVEHGQFVEIMIDDHLLHVQYAPHRYAVNPGTPVISPSSTGSPDNPYLELGVWNVRLQNESESACALFHHPLPGANVVVGK